METTVNEASELPEFKPGRVLRETENFRVVMDWKRGMEGLTGDEKGKDGRRFYIEPLNKKAEFMLRLAALTHNLKDSHFNRRKILIGQARESWEFNCLRADFTKDNLPILFKGKVTVPKSEKEDTIPSPDRMEACLEIHPSRYTISDHRINV